EPAVRRNDLWGWRRWRRAEVRRRASGNLNVLQVQNVEDVHGEDKPLRFGEVEVLRTVHVKPVEGSVAECISLERHTRGAVRAIRSTTIFVCIGDARPRINGSSGEHPDRGRDVN